MRAANAICYERVSIVTLPFGIEFVRQRPIGPGEPVVLCLCKNEEYYLDSLLKHYRDLGFAHFVFLDNGSTDRTRQILSSMDDVTLLTSTWPFGSYQHKFRQTLISHFGDNRWSLIVDADEFFVFPCSSTISLERFLLYLDDHKYNAVFTPLLDMFSANVLMNNDENHRTKFDASEYPLCSVETIRMPALHNKILTKMNRAFFRYRGGIREYLFGVSCALHKFSLTRTKDRRALYRTPHNVDLIRSNVADVSAVLLHYKFTHDFGRKIRSAISEKQYYKSSEEYKRYGDIVFGNVDIKSNMPAFRYDGIDDLRARGFGFVSDTFLDYVAT